MKKLWYIFGILLCMMLSFSACKSNNTASSEPSGNSGSQTSTTHDNNIASSDPSNTTATYNQYPDSSGVLKQLDNNVDFNTRLTKSYDIDIVKDVWYSKVLSMGVSSERGAIDDINAQMPIEILRQTGDNNYYTIYKIKDGGLLYVFFEKTGADSSFIRLRSSAYCEKNLKKSDFDSVNVGDPLSKVESIDPTARFANTSYDQTFTKHLLSDGFMVINYTKKDDTYLVSSIAYAKDSIVSFGEDNPEKFNFKILSKDFIAD